MLTKTVTLFWLAVLTVCTTVGAQPGFSLRGGIREIEFPFDYVNNFIILDIAFNGPVPLKFIYDTGAEHTILTKREISDFLHVQYEREFRIKGSDLKTEMIAYLARNIRLQILNKEVVAPDEDILVLQDDYFRFEEFAGVEVHGILAGRVFSNYIVKINYQRRVMTLYERNLPKLEKEGYTPIPFELFRNKIYLHASAQLRPDSVAPVKLLLDTGAGLPLMLFTHTHPLIQPAENALPTNIGMGLGGYLEGFVGRTGKVQLGPLEQFNVLTFFQEVDTTQDLTYLNGRNGLLGNTILSRFQVVIDYLGFKLWLKPTKYYQAAFVYDRSGLNIIAAGTVLNYFSVLNVLPGSPADEAGIHAGDRILRVGWVLSTISSLSDLQRVFQGKPGKKVKVVIKRDGKIMKKWVVLRDLI